MQCRPMLTLWPTWTRLSILVPFADHRVADGAAIDRGTGADLDVVLNDDAPDLRDLDVAASPMHKAEAVLTDLAARDER